MKKLIGFVAVALISSAAYSQECSPIFKSICATPVTLDPIAKEFFEIEKKIGESDQEINYVAQFKVFKINYDYVFTRRGSSTESLNALAGWSHQKLTMLEDDGSDGYYDAFDLLRHSREMNALDLAKFFEYQFSNLEDLIIDYRNGDNDIGLTLEQVAMGERYMEIKNQVKNTLIESLMGKDSAKGIATVYDLLDNDNENVPDTYVAIIVNNHIILIHRHWYL